ncbi:MOSC domain-containing protein [Streptomyces flavofungini]|uniref:MOSC domain-containing protein n=1 Tax=Streptomyces flavofungini TaxID=68200 RepID=UPI0025B25B55|nr:MOSC N-terminal beta barrel domain-containing protein [Streptomyces flavofungini]WJV50489.1 MOSC domain-containing protein [Streptomyces flavofungini]
MSTSVPVSIHSIHIHPLKAAGGHAAREAVVEPWGLAGDRRWVLIDSAGRAVTQRPHPRLASAAVEPLPDGGIRVCAPGREPLIVGVPEPGQTAPVEFLRDKSEAVVADPAADAWFSAFLDLDVRLGYLDAPSTRRPVDAAYGRPGETVSFADAFPLLLTTLSSLDALNSLIAQGDHADEGPLPMNRFRPNVVVEGVAPWAEDDWSRLAIGAVEFRVARKCARCVVTTTDQRTAERGKEPLRTLARHRRSGDRLLFGLNLIPESTGTIRIGDQLKILE